MVKRNKANANPIIPKPLAERLKGIIATPAPNDFDPEDVEFKNAPDNEDSESSDSEDSDAGREHYLNVGESKLRKQQSLQISHDPKYRGNTTSRSEIYSDSDVEGASYSDSDANDSDDSKSDNSSDVESNLTGDSSVPLMGMEDAELAAELKQAEEEEKALLASLTQKAVSDAVKGQHVKNQLILWEASLELNIHFHKLATLVNPLPQKPVGSSCENSMKETAHLTNTVSRQLMEIIYGALELREALWPADNPEVAAFPVSLKRPREEQLDLDGLWTQISRVSESYKPYCQATIEKWSNRVRVTEGLAGPEKKFKALNQSTLHQIQAALADTSRLVRRSQLKRTAYTVIGKGEDSKSEDNYDSEIYDDLDFYQQLLREFIDSRMVDNDHQNEMSGLRWAALKQDKQRKGKVVDTKASKGRKLRYHVHEKLQSFMAPVNVQKWHSEMVDELYASLFQRQSQVTKSDLPNDGLRIFG